MTIETRHFDLSALELRAGDDSTNRRAAGYAAVFNSDSYDLGGFTEIVSPGAFTRSLVEAQRGAINIFALWAHDASQPLGSTRSGKLVLAEDERGLSFDLDVLRFNPAQLDALSDNDLRMSFGFRVRDQEWQELDDGTILRTLKDVDLIEVSFVINPAYPATDAALRSMDAWRNEVREQERIDTVEQLKRVLMLQLSLRAS
jgi:uncharacterized protein